MIWQESEAAATVGGIPIMIRMGVIRNPPLTPNSPAMKPTTAPAPTSSGRRILIPAMGRKTHIEAHHRNTAGETTRNKKAVGSKREAVGSG